MPTRETLHELVNALPDDALAAAELTLTNLRDDPVSRAWLAAAPDDEPLSPEEIALLDESLARARRGEVVPDAVVRRLISD